MRTSIRSIYIPISSLFEIMIPVSTFSDVNLGAYHDGLCRFTMPRRFYFALLFLYYPAFFLTSPFESSNNYQWCQSLPFAIQNS